MKHYLIYKITNFFNNKIYIGQHITEDINDDYMGSGKLIQRSIEYCGIDNFEKKILYDFDNFEEMNEMEKKIVNEEFVLRDDTYNLTTGGKNNFHYINKHGLNHKSNQHLITAKKIKNDEEYRKWFIRRVKEGLENVDLSGENASAYNKKWIYNSDGDVIFVHKDELEKWLSNGWFKGRNWDYKHNDETIQKMKNTFKKINHQKGKKNSQYGTCWIYHKEKQTNKKIQKEDLEKWLGKGWTKGRKMKFS